MKLLALVSKYPPQHNAGAEWMLHEILKYLVSHGHEARVLLPMSELKEYEFEGVKVAKDVFSTNRDYIKGSDIVFTHLERAGKALNLAEYYHKPFVEIVHNTNRHGAIWNKWNKPEKFMYVIYNSEWTRSEMKYPCPGIILHPPVDAKRYKVKRGSKLTLINLFWRKGGLFFQHLARVMPDRVFLGVEGSYGKQEKDLNAENIEYVDNQPDMRKVYSQTRILLMPSVYESFGRTAIEAMVSGIPVIAHPTPGLKESLGEAGIFCDGEVNEWVEAIKKLDDEEEYKRVSKLSVERAKEVCAQSEKELAAMEKFLFDIIMKRQ